jgi:hypothetical protein
MEQLPERRRQCLIPAVARGNCGIADHPVPANPFNR